MKLLRIILILVLFNLSACGLFQKAEPAKIPVEAFTRVATQPNKCISPLAAVKYPGLLKHIPNDYSIKVFYETFGSAKKLIVDQFKAGRRKIGVNGLWEDNHTFSDKHIPKIKSIGKDLQGILNQFPDKEIKYRPFTEHKIAQPDKYLEIAQQACPSCIIVNSNWAGGFTQNPKFQNEVHGQKSYPKELLGKGVKYNYDYDGDCSHDSDRKSMIEKHSQAEEFSDWCYGLNLKVNDKDTTPRPNRIHRPGKRDFESLVFFHQVEKGTHNDMPKDWLYKSCADRHAPNDKDPRACTPVIIAPPNGKQIVCKMENGKKLFSFSNKGKYEDNKRFIYRPATFKKWGFQYAKQALQKTGKPLCTLFLDGKKVGRINPGYRDGQYRDHIQ